MQEKFISHNRKPFHGNHARRGKPEHYEQNKNNKNNMDEKKEEIGRGIDVENDGADNNATFGEAVMQTFSNLENNETLEKENMKIADVVNGKTVNNETIGAGNINEGKNDNAEQEQEIINFKVQKLAID